MICGTEDWRKGILLVTVHNGTPRGKVESRVKYVFVCLKESFLSTQKVHYSMQLIEISGR